MRGRAQCGCEKTDVRLGQGRHAGCAGRCLPDQVVATIFGDGNNVLNYIAVDDVADLAATILSRPDVVNETVNAGGPSNVSQNQLASLIERRLKSSGKLDFLRHRSIAL